MTLTRNTIVLYVWRVLLVTGLTITGYIHGQLYIDGYKYIHMVGLLFLFQSAASFAVAFLVLVRAPAIMLLGAAGVAVGALLGFWASRTIGVFGFTEHGFQPAPQSLISVIAELFVLVLLIPAALRVPAYVRQLRA